MVVKIHVDKHAHETLLICTCMAVPSNVACTISVVSHNLATFSHRITSTNVVEGVHIANLP